MAKPFKGNDNETRRQASIGGRKNYTCSSASAARSKSTIAVMMALLFPALIGILASAWR